jgi:hypothetical protein
LEDSKDKPLNDKLMTGKIIRFSMQALMLLLIMAFFSSSTPDQSAQTSGVVGFTVKTVTYNGDRSPKNIVAIWVEDNTGKFIKTRLLQADRRKQWLLTWNEKSKGSTVDAVTGATLNSHQTHSITWDCTDESGSLVADGDYKIVVEFTEEHAQGPLTSVSFSKGLQDQTIIPADLANFIDMKLEYKTSVTGVSMEQAAFDPLVLYPNPFLESVNLRFTLRENLPAEIRIFNLNGKQVREIIHHPVSPGEQSLLWDGTGEAGDPLPAGIYFIQLRAREKSHTESVLKLAD